MAISPATVAPTPPSLRLLVRPCKAIPPAFTTRRRSIRKRVCLRTMGQTSGPGLGIIANHLTTGLIFRAQFVDGPQCMFSYHRVRPGSHLFQFRNEITAAAVAHRYRHIALQTGKLCALHGRAPKSPAEFFFCHLRQPLQFRMDQLFIWLQFTRRTRRSIAALVVPRANILADVAAEDLMADGRAQFRRDLASFFNGEISDAAAGIHLSRRDEGLSGAGTPAARGASAAVGGRTIGGG